MTRHRALFVSLSSFGGLAHYANEFCNALALEFDTVILLTLEPFEVPSRFRRYRVETVSKRRIKNRFDRLFYMAGALIKELQLTSKERPAVVFLNAYQSPLDWWYCVLRPSNVPVLCVQHEVQPRVAGKRISWFQSDFYKQVTGVVVHKNTDAESLLRNKYRVKSNIVLIDQGLYESDIFGKGVYQGDVRKDSILSFGSVRADKGIDLLVRAYPGAKACNGLKLVIAGKSKADCFACIQDEIRYHDKDVEWVNEYIPLKETGRYYFSAQFLVFPFIVCRQSASLRLAIFFEKPVIVTDTGELPIIVSKYRIGLVVPPGDVDALRGAIVELSNNLELCKQFTANIRKLRDDKTFSWAWIIRDLLDQIGC